MRVAIQGGPVPVEVDQLTDEVAAGIAALGFGGVACHFGSTAGEWATPDRVTTDMCRRARDVLERHGLTVAYSWSFWASLVPLDTPEKMKLAIDAVGSPMIKGGADPVNWMKLEHVYDTTGFIRHIFDVLGDDLVIAHAKDVYLEPRLVLHLTETVQGRGWI